MDNQNDFQNNNQQNDNQQNDFQESYQDSNVNQAPYNYTPIQPTNKAFGIASMVCGILSLICCCCNEWFSIALSVAAIVLFVLEKVLVKNRTGFATAGLICGIISLVLTVLLLIFAAVILSSGFMESLESILTEYGFDASSMVEF